MSKNLAEHDKRGELSRGIKAKLFFFWFIFFHFKKLFSLSPSICSILSQPFLLVYFAKFDFGHSTNKILSSKFYKIPNHAFQIFFVFPIDTYPYESIFLKECLLFSLFLLGFHKSFELQSWTLKIVSLISKISNTFHKSVVSSSQDHRQAQQKLDLLVIWNNIFKISCAIIFLCHFSVWKVFHMAILAQIKTRGTSGRVLIFKYYFAILISFFFFSSSRSSFIFAIF